MKKKIAYIIMLLLSLAIISACNNNSGGSGDTNFLNAQIIRHDNWVGIFESTSNRIITVVSSRYELEQFYEFACPTKFIMDIEHYACMACTFWQTITEYNDTFFTENYLVFVMLYEGSGSVRHEVGRIEGNGDIIINRLSPGQGVPMTGDMAYWTIIIEISKDFQPEQFNMVFINKVIS
ncbi:MAG: hypothetical protein FWB91_01660 [Defluviitaleaceae bacterium]|nr:hypothetical protein [Defluviitaleaceae bacterium]